MMNTSERSRVVRDGYLPFILIALYTGWTPVISVCANISGLGVPAYGLVTFIGISLIGFILLRKNSATKKELPWSIILTIASYMLVAAISYYRSDANLMAPKEKIVAIGYSFACPLIVTLALFHMSSKKRVSIQSVETLVTRLLVVACYLFLALFLTFKMQDGETSRYILPGLESPIWVSRMFGAGAVANASYLLMYKSRNKALYKCSLVVNICALIYSASRGPLIGLIIASSVAGVVQSRVNFVKLSGLAMCLAGIGTSMVALLGNTSTLLSNYTYYHRIWQLERVFKDVNWFGNGISSFGRLYQGIDENLYPHNLFAEVYFEYGVIGALGLLAVVIWFFRIRVKGICWSMGLYFLINSMISGDISSATPFFLYMIAANGISKLDGESLNLTQESQYK